MLFKLIHITTSQTKEGKRSRSRVQAITTTIRAEVSLPALIAERKIPLKKVDGDQMSSARMW